MKNDESESESDTEDTGYKASTDNVINTTVPTEDDTSENELGEEKEDNNKNMREKYLKLVEHNSQLVEILQRTMEVQTDLFRRILKYMFP